jgi:hypothetical protein
LGIFCLFYSNPNKLRAHNVTAAIGYNIWVTFQNLLEGDFMGKWYPLRNKWRHYLEAHYAHNGLI